MGEEPRADVSAATEEYRSLRAQVERAIRPLATSLDGRRFTLQASPHDLAFQTGGYVTLAGDPPALGQVTRLELATEEGANLAFAAPDGSPGAVRASVRLRVVRGEGVVLGGEHGPFHDAEARPAAADEVAALLEALRPRRATLGFGELLLVPGVQLRLDAAGFGRHTFLCGQSGSGKTYALGLLLEQLLQETSLRLVVLDPNSDYVRLGEARSGPDADAAASYRDRARVDVRTARDDGPDRLRLRFAELEPATQAAVLGLDPIADRDEYAELVALVEEARGAELAPLTDLAASRPGAEPLAQRARNLGLAGWKLWAGADPGSLVEELRDGDWRCLVVDLGSLGSHAEQVLAADALVSELWRGRARREPVLVVVDEAHTLCPTRPEDVLTARATEHLVAIAGEGRKFGLYLLVASQRPQKVHENVLSQCDNLLLMRMNSAADLAAVGEVFSFVPPGLLERATAFRQGECLVAGALVSHPALARVGARVSQEGGADVPATWADQR
jgi:hypothetical protein